MSEYKKHIQESYRKALGLIAILILILIVLGVFEYLSLKKSYLVHTHPQGAFSFTYPSRDFVISTENNTTYIGKKDNFGQGIMRIMFGAEEGLLADILGNTDFTTISAFGGYSTLVSEGDSVSSRKYIVFLDETSQQKKFVVIDLVDSDMSEKEKDKRERILESLIIYYDSALGQTEQVTKIKERNIQEADIRMKLASLRTSMNDYSRACSTKMAELDTYLTGIKYEGERVCMDEKEGYALSLKMPSQAIMCIDSNNFAGDISRMITGYSCNSVPRY